MQNQLTQTTTTNIGSRILNSIVGIFVGGAIFLASFGILWWNEGRVDLSILAKKAVQVDANKPDTTNNGKLVAVSGAVETDDNLSDDPYIKPDKYIILKRSTEMYSWVEHKESSSSTSTGGSETTTTGYTYSKEWKSFPENSSNFKDPTSHENPSKSLADADYRTNLARIGVYGLVPQSVDALNLTSLHLTSQNTKTTADVTLASENYLYKGKDTLNTPEIGDVRISYSALHSGTPVTLFGKLNGSLIESYSDSNGNHLFRIFLGSFSDAVNTLHTEYTTMLWIFRFIGFLLMWIGLSMVFAPISVVLDILPVFGSLSRTLIGVITFIVSLILTTITILIGIIFHNIFLLIVTLIAVFALAYVFIHMKKSTPTVHSADSNPLSSPPADVDPQLAAYISQMRAQGMNNQQLLQALTTAGWPTSVAMHALGMRGLPQA